MLELSGDPPAVSFRWPENRVGSKRLLSNTSIPVWQGEYIYSARTGGRWSASKRPPAKSLEHE